jgi:hypothetical protein
MPWYPELFSGPALARAYARDTPAPVPYFAGLMTGETDALIHSFAGEPELHHPVRGRVRGVRAFAAFASETHAWLKQSDVSVEDVDRAMADGRGIEEVILHADTPAGRVHVPVAIVADRQPDQRIKELRIYRSTWSLTGRHAHRPPLLQPDPELRQPAVVDEYQRALAAGDVDAIVATFEPGGYAREPAGDRHRGRDGLREFYGRLFSNDGGIALEHCAVTDDGRICGLEYNVVRWGQTELPPEAGVAVYVRGESGKLAAARIYDDAGPPLR